MNGLYCSEQIYNKIFINLLNVWWGKLLLYEFLKYRFQLFKIPVRTSLYVNPITDMGN